MATQIEIPAYRDDTTIIFAWKKEFDEKEKNTTQLKK